jgi:dipeptidyl aminopeptidase/acylaminoacyl peptidase
VNKRILTILATVMFFAVPYGRAQEAAIAPGNNLVVKGVPKISPALAETAGRYGSYRAAVLSDWHPARREMLVATRFAPTNNIAKIKKPMLVVAGKNDPRLPVTESEQIVEALKKQNVPVWYLTAKDEGHGFRKKQNQDFQFYTTIEFLQEYLLK